MLFQTLQSLFLPENECICLLKIHVLETEVEQTPFPPSESVVLKARSLNPSSSTREHFRNAGCWVSPKPADSETWRKGPAVWCNGPSDTTERAEAWIRSRCLLLSLSILYDPEEGKAGISGLRGGVRGSVPHPPGRVLCGP